MDKVNVGELAESQLKLWADEAGLICNKADYDRTGWDYFLEFPTEYDPADVPWDRKSSGLTCFVQVKGTRSSRTRKSIKLSVWDHLVKRPLPTFFVIIRFREGTTEVEEVHLIHVGEPHIERVLERLREASTESDPRPLHRRTLNLTWDDSNQLSAPYSTALVKEIGSIIGDSLDDYIQRKREFKESVGYDQASSEFKLKIKIPEEYQGRPKEYLIDWSLGLVDSLDIIEGEVSDVRFGTSIPVSGDEDFREGVLTTSVEPQRTVTLTFVRPREDRRASMIVDAYGPAGVMAIVDNQNFKARFRNEYCDLLISKPENLFKLDFTFPRGNRSDRLDQLTDFASVCHLLWSASEAGDAEVEIEFDGNFIASFGPIEDVPEDLRIWSDVVLSVGRVALACEIPRDIEVKLADIYREAETFEEAGRVISGLPRPGLVRLGLEEDAEVDLTGVLVCIPEVTELTIGEHVVRLVVANTAVHHQSEQQSLFLRYVQTTLYRVRTRRSSEDWEIDSQTDLEDLFEEYDAREGFVAVPWWELNK